MIAQVYRRLVTAIHRDEEHRLNRRALLHLMAVCSGALALAAAPVAILARWAERSGPKRAATPAGVPVAAVADVPPGTAKLFHFPTEHDPAVLVHLADGRMVAYDRRCTHLQCPVLWDAEHGQLACPCHHGYFDPATGAALAGPPRRPLPAIELQVRDGQVFAVGGGYRGVKTDGA